MGPDNLPSFTRLITLADRASADLCAALLRSAGITCRLRGESLGPYRLTIGDMAATEVWVPVDELEEARALLEDADLPGGVAEPAGPRPVVEPDTRRVGWWPVVAVVLLALLAWGLLGYFL